MFSRARIFIFAVVLTLVGFSGAILAPENALANRFRGGGGGGGGNRSFHVTHFQPQRSRQSFRPSFQSRPRVVSRPSFNRHVSASRPSFRPRVARQSSSANRRFGTGNFQRPRTFGGGSPRPTRLSNVQRVGAFGRQNRQSNNTTALHQPKLVTRQTGGQPFSVSHLPKPNSIGSTRDTGNRVATRPFNLANLPRPNSLGGSHNTPNALGGSQTTANNSATRPFNLANLPKPNSLSTSHEPKGLGGAHETGNKSVAHPFSIASLPKPNSLAGTHAANRGTHQDGIAAQHNNLHDVAKKTSKEGAVVASAEKVGGDKEQLKDDKNKSAADAKKVQTDTAAADKAKGDLDAASKAAASAQLALNAATKANAPKAVIAQDLARLKDAQSKMLKADTTLLNDNSKLAADRNAAAADKKNVSADQKVLQQDKATLSDKEKIAKQASEITKLKNANGSNDQSADNGQGSNNQSDNGQGSNNQSSDNGQNSSSNDGGNNNQTTSSNSGGSSNSNGSNGNYDSGRNSTVIDNSTRGTTVVAGATSVTRGAAAAVTPAPAPQQLAAVSPTDPDPNTAPAADPTFVMVVFQKDISNDDITAFLKAYNASIADGPNADGLYKVQLSDPVPADQIQQVLDSMKSQTNVVLSAAAN